MRVTDKRKIKFGVLLDDCIWRRHRRKSNVADSMDMSRVTLTHYTTGQRIPTVETFMRIANELEMTDEEIIECMNAFRDEV